LDDFQNKHSERITAHPNLVQARASLRFGPFLHLPLAVIKNYISEVNSYSLVNLLIIKTKDMKRIIISMALLLGVIANSFAQQIDTSAVLTREAYMEKSRSQRAGSVVLILAGCAIGLVGGNLGALNEDSPVGPVSLGVGVGCIAGGVALRIASKRNRKKALDASAHFNLQSVSSYQFMAMGKPPIPAFTIKLSLN
jgi:hypothetical protein